MLIWSIYQTEKLTKEAVEAFRAAPTRTVVEGGK